MGTITQSQLWKHERKKAPKLKYWQYLTKTKTTQTIIVTKTNILNTHGTKHTLQQNRISNKFITQQSPLLTHYYCYNPYSPLVNKVQQHCQPQQQWRSRSSRTELMGTQGWGSKHSAPYQNLHSYSWHFWKFHVSKMHVKIIAKQTHHSKGKPSSLMSVFSVFSCCCHKQSLFG